MQQKRMYGLDLLRIISMFGIIGLHLFNNGGILESLNVNSINYYPLLFIYVLCYLSVNIFAMLSGYLYIDKKNIKYNNIFQLITTTFFYCLIITVIFYGFNIFRIREQGIVYFISSIVPPIVGRYWYITSYVLLFFMIPYMNFLIHNISKDKLKKMLCILLILLSVIPTLIGLRDLFSINNGYSPFWLIYCYMLGAYAKLHLSQEKSKCIKYMITTVVIAWILNSVTRIISFNLIGKIVLNDIFINYISPLNVIASLSAVLIFSKITIKNISLTKIIKLLSSTSFSVYIIHSHILIFDFIIKDSFVGIKNYNLVLIIAIILVTIIGIYMLCSIIDILKNEIFKLMKINDLIDMISKKIENIENVGKKNE